MKAGSMNPERDAAIYRQVREEGRSVLSVARQAGLSPSRVQRIIFRIENPPQPRTRVVKAAPAPKPAAPEWPAEPYQGPVKVIRGVEPRRSLRLGQDMLRVAELSRKAEPSLKALGASTVRP